jgi:hypothetical protein
MGHRQVQAMWRVAMQRPRRNEAAVANHRKFRRAAFE